MILSKKVVPRQIIILTAFSVALNFIYLFWSDSIFSLYILWNIILAFVPFLLSFYLLKYRKDGGKKLFIYIIGLFLWLLFFPNAPYMVTDIIHIGESIGVPRWFDAITLFTSVWAGVLLGIYSLSHIEELLLTKYSKRFSCFLLALVAFFASFGIYLGRFFRYNSWDIVAHPGKLFFDTFKVFSRPDEYGSAYFFILVFFVFILTSYYAWKFNNKKIME